MTISSSGAPSTPLRVSAILRTTFNPGIFATWPKAVYWPLNEGTATAVMKNLLPFRFGARVSIARTPATLNGKPKGLAKLFELRTNSSWK